MGNNSIENTTIMMDRRELYDRILFTCSNGVLWNYNGYANNNEVVIVSITNIRLMQLKNTHSTCDWQGKVLEISLKWFNVFVNIQHSNFLSNQATLWSNSPLLHQHTMVFHSTNAIFKTLIHHTLSILIPAKIAFATKLLLLALISQK